jgi:hypothetical protein
MKGLVAVMAHDRLAAMVAWDGLAAAVYRRLLFAEVRE